MESEIKEFIEDYDWSNALDNCGVNGHDIVDIIAKDEGENDGESWVAVLLLNNGLYVVIDAWCDYTGWDCQSGGQAEEDNNLEDLRRWKMTSSQRRRLNMALPDLDDIPNQPK